MVPGGLVQYRYPDPFVSVLAGPRLGGPRRASRGKKPNDGRGSNDMHQHEHADTRRGCPRERARSPVTQKQQVWQERQKQNPEGNPAKKRLGPIRAPTNEGEDHYRAERAYGRKEDRGARSSQRGKITRNFEGGQGGPTHSKRRDDGPDERLEPTYPQPVFSRHLNSFRRGILRDGCS